MRVESISKLSRFEGQGYRLDPGPQRGEGVQAVARAKKLERVGKEGMA